MAINVSEIMAAEAIKEFRHHVDDEKFKELQSYIRALPITEIQKETAMNLIIDSRSLARKTML